MQHEHTNRDEVGVTQVVDEAADVAVVTGVDAVHFAILHGGERTLATKTLILTHRFSFSQWLAFADLIVKVKQVGVVFPDIRLCV